MTTQQRLEELEQQIEDLKNSFPAHSIPTAMFLTLDELEEELEQIQKSNSGEIDAST